jgi:cell division protein FtsQ
VPSHGYVARLANGPEVWLGAAARLDAKWAAAAAVLAQESSQGANYIDVRIPERPVAGGVAVPADSQAAPEAPAPGAIPGSPAAIPAAPPAAAAAGQPPTATTPAQTPATTTSTPAPNTQP